MNIYNLRILWKLLINLKGQFTPNCDIIMACNFILNLAQTSAKHDKSCLTMHAAHSREPNDKEHKHILKIFIIINC